LHYAAKLNHLPVVQALLNRGAFYAAQDSQGRTPTQLTTDSTIRSLLDATDELFHTVKEGSLTEVMSSPNQGVEINARDSEGKTVLHVAAQSGHVEIVDALLQRNIDVNALDDHQWTPLHLAAHEGQLDVIQLLLEKGADFLAKNRHDTVLHQAVSGNNPEVIKSILNKMKEKCGDDSQAWYAAINAQDTDGDTPLMWAADGGKIEAAQILLNYGVDINAKNKESLTALHWSILTDHLDVAMVLMEHKDIKLNVDQRGKIINHLIEHHSGEMTDVLIAKLLPSFLQPDSPIQSQKSSNSR
jgi:ankyrin repeat protein